MRWTAQFMSVEYEEVTFTAPDADAARSIAWEAFENSPDGPFPEKWDLVGVWGADDDAAEAPAGAVANPVPQVEGVGGAATPPAAPPILRTEVLLRSVGGDPAITKTGDGPASVPCGSEEDDLALALRHVSGCARCLTLLGWDQ